MDGIISDWRQTDEDIYIDLDVGGDVKTEDADVHVEDGRLVCRLKDGRHWTCMLSGNVVQSSVNVIVKDGTLTIQMLKQEKFKEWDKLQESVKKRSGSRSEMEMDVSGLAVNSDHAVIGGNRSMAGGGDGVKEGQDDGQNEEQMDDGEEEEYLLDHIKNDFYPRHDQKVLYLHVYVKKINKESVNVTFLDDEIRIRFKTSDNQFLQLHPDTTSDTMFCWRIKPWRPIDPSGSTYRVAKSNLEVIIKKRGAEKWKALECSTRDSAADTPPRTGSQGAWVPLSKVKPPSPRDKAEIPKDRGSEKDALRGAVGGAKSVEIKETSVRTKKPTCAVPPLSLGQQPEPPPPAPAPPLHQGFCGLDNLGNTCFMNSVLQVLANTRELKDYMLGADFKNEINRDNPLGSGGHLVLSFAVLMRRLWSGQHKSLAPSKLKSIISAKASQFMGFAQHDAQEFMAFLLDGLHEDINRIQKKPYTETVDSDGRADQVVADEAWMTHRRRNDSFIVDLFQGQYKSKLVCPECNKVSITFDPFMHLSVPLPKKKRQFGVYFFSRDCRQRPVRYVVSLSCDATVHQLTVQVAQRAGVHAANLRVYEVHRSYVHKVFSRKSTLAGVSVNDIIFVQEVLSPAMAGENVVELYVIQRMLLPRPPPCCSHCKRSCEKGRTLKRCTKCLRAAYCDQACQKSNWNMHRSSCRRAPEPLGCPFIVSLPRSHATYARLCQLMESFARYSTNVFVPPYKSPAPHPSPANRPSTSTTDPSPTDDPAPTQGDASPSPHRTGSAAQEPADVEQGGETGRDTTPDRTRDPHVGGEGEVDVGVDGKESARMETGAGGDDPRTGSGEGRDQDPGGSSDSSPDAAHTATVMGQPQMPERKMPLFFLKPVNHAGTSIHSTERLSDEGDKPLDLAGITCLGMDWRNDPKQDHHVLIESRNLDCVEDESCSNNISQDQELSLKQCLNLFTEPEKLSPEEAWYCPKCKQHREATKQMLLWRLPSTLIIQMKRFSFGNMLWRDKIDKMVEYPVRGLDLSPYCHGHHNTPLIYDLYGVINHHGGILGGHYTAFSRLVSTEDWSKNEHDWRLFDDNHVSPMSERSAVVKSAYLLFYRRRQPYSSLLWREPGRVEGEATQDQEDSDDKSSSSSSEQEEAVEADQETSQPIPSPTIHTPDNRFTTAPPPKASMEAESEEKEEEREGEQEEVEEPEEMGYTNMEDID